jgi:[ribosomal protein S18]-alanine N-acetyltransferase
MPLTLRYMRLADVPQVVAIDQVSFRPPWSARSYAYEITESTYSHMVVLEDSEGEQPLSLWQRLLGTPRDVPRRILGYGGLWNISDEAHISTIASHPAYRGRGLGEIALAGMVVKAIFMRASYIILEVRVSNVAAQNLYKKYAFDVFELKKGYYHSDGEDAYDMRLDLVDAERRNRLLDQYAALKRRIPFTDLYTQTPRVR